MSSQEASSNQRDRLVTSLKFGGLNERYNHIAESHEGTFRWALRSAADNREMFRHLPTPPLWPNFSEWLQSDQQLYWISGLPGSGKSTFVKFLVDSEEIMEGLKKWQSDCVVLKHFFWKAGGGMQASLRGFWSSLAYQQLAGNPTAFGSVMTSYPQTRSITEPGDWSVKQLEKVSLASMAGKSFCIFVDGLDEINDDDGAEAIMQAIHRIIDSLGTKVKFCLSSRPEQRFRSRLTGVPEMQLHLLTSQDMFTFTEETLSRSSIIKSLDIIGNSSIIENSSINGIIKSLVFKAQGVFLWLALALKSVIRGLEQGDNFDDIQQRIEHLPGDLDRLYTDMWNRLNEDKPIYRETAARIFRLVLAHRRIYDLHRETWRRQHHELSLRILAIAMNLGAQQTIVDEKSKIEGLNIGELSQKMQQAVEVRCAGMLELVELRRGKPTVRFIHKTAYDYLTTTEVGMNILEGDTAPLCEVYLGIARALLIESFIAQTETAYHEKANNILGQIITSLDYAMAESTQVEVEAVLDRVFDDYYLPPRKEYGSLANQPLQTEIMYQIVLLDKLWPWARRKLSSLPDSGSLLSHVLRRMVDRSTHSTADKVMNIIPTVTRLVQLGADPTVFYYPPSSVGRDGQRVHILYEWIAWCRTLTAKDGLEPCLKLLARLVRSQEDLSHETVLTKGVHYEEPSAVVLTANGSKPGLQHLPKNPEHCNHMGFVFRTPLSFWVRYCRDQLGHPIDSETDFLLDNLCQGAPKKEGELLCVHVTGQSQGEYMVLRCVNQERTGHLLKEIGKGWYSEMLPEDNYDIIELVSDTGIEAEDIVQNQANRFVQNQAKRDAAKHLRLGLVSQLQDALDTGILEVYHGSIYEFLKDMGLPLRP